MASIFVTVRRDGRLAFLYTDALQDLLLEGVGRVIRAGHVEPDPTSSGSSCECSCGCTWSADLSPVGGPLLGPFTTREQALAEEVSWLLQHYL